jgi:hypothetical protein
MLDHWIVEADDLDMRYHTLAESPNDAVTNWFEDLDEEEINLNGGLFIYDNDDTEEHLMSIAFAAIRRKLISNGAFYKIINNIGLDVDNPTYELLKANKGTQGIFRETESGFFRKIKEESDEDAEDEWNNF